MEGAGGKQHLRDCSCGSPPLVQSCWLSGACEGVNVASVFFLGGGARGVGIAVMQGPVGHQYISVSFNFEARGRHACGEIVLQIHTAC